MGWLYVSNLKGHKTPKAYLDDQFTFAGEHAQLRVLSSALVHMKRHYAAVERTDECDKRHSSRSSVSSTTTCVLRIDASCNGMLPSSATLCATGGIPDALLSCRPVQSNLAT
jgi:hypothetical protein